MAKKTPVNSPIADAIRASGLRKPKVRRLPRMQQPDAIRLSYFRALKAVLKDIRAAVAKHIIPALKELPPPEPKSDGSEHHGRMDASDMDPVHKAIEKAVAEVAKKWTAKNISKVVQPIAWKTSNFGRKQLADQFKAALGLDIVIPESELQ
jgi:hypothetical protein